MSEWLNSVADLLSNWIRPPGHIENLTAELDPVYLVLTLTWNPPSASLSNSSNVTEYDIRYGTDGSESTAENKSTMTSVPARTQRLMITRQSGLIPFSTAWFEVRARYRDIEGSWSRVTMRIDWHCRLPRCLKNRHRDPDGTIYGFCKKEHAMLFAENYCLAPFCRTIAASSSYFCDGCHAQSISEGFPGTVVNLDPQSHEYEYVQNKFYKRWAPETLTGPCRAIHSILLVVNPALSKEFEEYRTALPKEYQKAKKFFHGTTLECNIMAYLELCNNKSCGVCAVTKRGFNPRYTQFGHGIHVAYNSSKFADYPISERHGGYCAMLMCLAAPGKIYKLQQDEPNLPSPPSGYHSVCRKRKGIFKLSALKDNEFVLYNSSAICPQYVIIYNAQ